MELDEGRQASIALIRESASAISGPEGDYARVRSQRFSEPGYGMDDWKKMVELGWPALRVAEENGGSGLGMLELCALAQELGRRLSPQPLIEVACAARHLPADIAVQILEQGRIIVPAIQEAENGLDFSAKSGLEGGKLSGRKLFVASAAGADGYLVSTANGFAYVDAKADGVSIDSLVRQDGGYLSTLTFDKVEARPVDGDASILFDELAMSTAAYLLGVMDRAFEMTVDYLKVREQFGHPIGSYQSLQHVAVDMKIQLELARSVVNAAARTFDGDDPLDEKRAAVSRAKARASDAASMITRMAIQLHGGIGYTDEADPGLFLRKVMVLQNLYGSAAFHRDRFDVLSPEGDAEATVN